MAVRTAQANATDKPGDLALNWLTTVGQLKEGQVHVAYEDTLSSGEIMTALELLKITLLEDLER